MPCVFLFPCLDSNQSLVYSPIIPTMHPNCLLRVDLDVLSIVFSYIDICHVKMMMDTGDTQLARILCVATTALAHMHHQDVDMSRNRLTQTAKRVFSMVTNVVKNLNFFPTLQSLSLVAVPWINKRKCRLSLNIQWLPKTLTMLELCDVVLINPAKQLPPVLKSLHLMNMSVSNSLTVIKCLYMPRWKRITWPFVNYCWITALKSISTRWPFVYLTLV